MVSLIGLFSVLTMLFKIVEVFVTEKFPWWSCSGGGFYLGPANATNATHGNPQGGTMSVPKADLRLVKALRESIWSDFFLQLQTCRLRGQIEHDQFRKKKHAYAFIFRGVSQLNCEEITFGSCTSRVDDVFSLGIVELILRLDLHG
jgi:hypothetical protein